MHSDCTRRAFLAALTSIGALPAWAQSSVVCPNDPTISSQGSPLTIDTHAHIFNGSDLQVKQFLSQTTVDRNSELYPLVNAMGGVLQALAWHLAPSANTELAALQRFASQIQNCQGEDQLRRVADPTYEQGYQLGRAQLQVAAAAAAQLPGGAEMLGPRRGEAGLVASINDLPSSYRALEDRRSNPATVLGSQPHLFGYISFVLHHFNQRHVNAIDYFNTYSKGSSRKVDLMVACLVDYDYWLDKGRSTPTSLVEQVELMGLISAVLGGRMHGFVAFCPFRELATLDAQGMGNSLRLVRHAIEVQGFIGVKLYPPMGFAPWGNSNKNVWQNKPNLLPQAADPKFGESLDKAMNNLFTYCQTNEVPILAHTNHSNGPYDDFKALAGSEYWKFALDRFPGLRVNFGHFGDTDPEDHNGEKTVPFLKLMTRGAGTPGVNAFADSGYFAGTLLNQIKMRNVLSRLYAAEGRVMLERLMYGTDWSMILPQQRSERYLSDFMDVMRRLDEAEPGVASRGASLADAFFGRNAVEFLGLRSGRANRTRLNAFYGRNNVPTPDWMRKVDALV